MIDLVQTCFACPEQYDAMLDGERVGYLRLRHGQFTVECPGVEGLLVCSAVPAGDGAFEDHERDYHFRYAVASIEAWIAAGRPSDLAPFAAPDVTYTINGRAPEKAMTEAGEGK